MEKKSGLRRRLRAAAFVFLVLLLLAPLSMYSILALGFPPVVGNLAAARGIRAYAAQVYPSWAPEGIWAGYNLVDDGYYLSFSDGAETYTLSCAWPEDLIEDEARAAELLEQAEVARAIRVNGLWIADQLTTSCSVRWAPKEPDVPLIFVTSTFYTQPELTERALRSQMADVGMKVYEALSPVVSIRRLSIHCGQRLPQGNTWTVLTLELEEGTPVTRELLLTAPVTVK